jgi:hypothetical protein
MAQGLSWAPFKYKGLILMLNPLSLTLGLVLLASTPVLAQTPIAFDVPVETLPISKAKAGLMENAATVGDYSVIGRLYSVKSTGVFSLTEKTRVRVDYKFLDKTKASLLTAKCLIADKTSSVFGIIYEQKFSELYSCEFKDKPATDYAFELIMPKPTVSNFSIGGLGLQKIDPDAYKVMAGKLRYKGVTYEAKPLSLDAQRLKERVVTGFVISKDGKPIGSIDFDGKARDKGVMTAPKTDDREAVIFFALSLLFAPDPEMRNQ